MWILSLTTTVYETYHYTSTYTVSYSFCNGTGKKLYFHLWQDENRYQNGRKELTRTGKIYLYTVQGNERHEYIYLRKRI